MHTEASWLFDQIGKIDKDLEQAVRQRIRELENSNQELREEIANQKRTQDSLAVKEVPPSVLAGPLNDSAIFENTRDILLRIRQVDGQILEANRAAEQAYGYTRSELLALRVNDLRVSDSDELIQSQIQQASEGSLLFETCHRRKNGSVFPVEVSSIGAELAGEKGVLSIVRDISQRKRVERELAESEERYRSLVELSPETIAVHSDGRLVFLNAAGARLAGVNCPEQLLGVSVSDLLPPESRQKNIEMIQKMAGGLARPEDFKPVEDKLVRPDGSMIDVEMVGGPVLFQGKQAFQLIIRDITEQKNARQAIHESEHHLRVLVEAAPLGIHQYELRPDGQLIFSGANPAADRILGIDHSKMVGLAIEDAFPTHRQTDIPAIFKQVAVEGIPYSCEQVDYKDDQIQGAFDIHAFQTGPARMAVFFQDVTEKKKSD